MPVVALSSGLRERGAAVGAPAGDVGLEAAVADQVRVLDDREVERARVGRRVARPRRAPMTRTRAVAVRERGGTVHANEPVFAIPVAIVVRKLAPPSVEYARSIAVTPTLSVAFQVMFWAEPVAPALAAVRRGQRDQRRHVVDDREVRARVASPLLPAASRAMTRTRTVVDRGSGNRPVERAGVGDARWRSRSGTTCRRWSNTRGRPTVTVPDVVGGAPGDGLDEPTLPGLAAVGRWSGSTVGRSPSVMVKLAFEASLAGVAARVARQSPARAASSPRPPPEPSRQRSRCSGSRSR